MAADRLSQPLIPLIDELRCAGLAGWLDEPLERRLPAVMRALFPAGQPWAAFPGLPARPTVADLLRARWRPEVEALHPPDDVARALRAAVRAAALEARLQAPRLGDSAWLRWFAERGLRWVGLQFPVRYAPDFDGRERTVAACLAAELPKKAWRKREVQERVLAEALCDVVAVGSASRVQAIGPRAAACALAADALEREVGAFSPRDAPHVAGDPSRRTVRVSFLDRGCEGGVAGGFVRFDEHGVPEVSAACAHDWACGWTFATAAAVAAWLDSPEGGRFDAGATAPDWRRALVDLHGQARPAVATASLERDERVRVTLLRPDGRPIRREVGEVLDPCDRDVLLAESHGGVAVLRALARHPRVVCDGRRVQVREVAPEIAVGREGGKVRLRLRAGEWTGGRADADALPHAGWVVWLPSSPEVVRWFARTPELDRVIAWIDTPFPLESAPELLDALEGCGVPVGRERGLLGEPATWDGTLRIELSFLAGTGLTGRARVRLPGGYTVDAGAGDADLLVDVAGRPVELRRDLPAERARVDALWDDAGLDAFSGPPGVPDAFLVRELADVVATMRRLEGRPGVELAWRAPFRVERLGPEQVALSVVTMGAWLRVDGGVAGSALTLSQILAAIRDRKHLVLVGSDAVVELAAPLFDALSRLADTAEEHDGTLRVGAVHAAVPAEDLLGRAIGKRPREPEDVAIPATLRATLRPYQAEGFRFLARRAAWAPGAVLADDMGLGKTVQAVALLCARPGPALVVAPTSVVPNWRSELARFAPHLAVVEHVGGGRDRALAPAAGTVVVTSWDLLVRDEILAEVRWDVVVLDEAHAVKNPRTRRAAAAATLDAAFRVALTGTPLENRLAELRSLMGVVVPGLLPDEETFEERFLVPIEHGRDAERLARLRAIVHPFLLRRTKADVAPELPPKTEVVERVVLRPPERDAYEAIRLAAIRAWREESGRRARMRLFASLTRLRQVACDLRLVEPAAETVGAKVARLVELTVDLRAAGERALVFSEFTTLLDLCEPALGAEGLAFLRLDGATPARERKRRIDAFQEGDGDLFLLSRKAGGFGINLTAATAVIHLDPWWNPAVEDQATDRAHRIGQDRPVTVIRLVSRDTLEERVLALHQHKRALVAGVLDGATAGAALRPEELAELLG